MGPDAVPNFMAGQETFLDGARTGRMMTDFLKP
jgi:hypothetical protein